MKRQKIISLVLSVTIIFSVLLAAPFSSNAVSVKKYKSVVKKALVSQRACEITDYRGQSFLYDFDNNGTKELVMIYGEKAKFYLSVYAVEKNKAKPIIKKQYIQSCAGNARQSIGIAKRDGKKYLIFTKGNSFGGGYYNNFVFYKISGSKISKKYTASERFTRNSSSQEWEALVKAGGKKRSLNNYVKWHKHFKVSYVKRVLTGGELNHYNYSNYVLKNNPNEVTYFADKNAKMTCKTIRQIYKKVANDVQNKSTPKKKQSLK